MIFLQSHINVVDDNELSLARIYFSKASTEETAANNLKTLTEAKQNEAIFKAYHGASLAILAKYSWNPYKKLENVRNGLLFLNTAVAMNLQDIEIRFLRLSIEEHIPSAISFTKHMQADKDFIIQHLNNSHPNYSTIKSYLLISKYTTEADRKKL